VKLAVVAVGKLKEAWVQEGCAEYAKRVRGKLPLELVEVKDDAELVRKIPPRYKLWALDERGRELASEELAASLNKAMNGGEQGIALVIGGADGLPKELVARADFVWSLGRATLPHRLARLIVLEQLYRALSILRGEPYHRP
jgi:23S rRNA (pseudouridine1915-N3)-methyltransferase